MLRPVSFPATNMDLLEFCTPSLQALLRSARDQHGDAHGMAFGGVKKPRLEEAPPAASVTSGPAAPDADDELAAALRMSLEADAASGGAGSSSAKPAAAPPALTSAGVGLPASFRGFYDLFAIVSHKGRSADSGHYMAWARIKGDDWIVFDDESASESALCGVFSGCDAA